MKTRLLLAAAFLCAAPVWAQTDAPANGLPFPLVSPAQAEKLAGIKPISLHLREVTLGAALQELQKQSGVALDLTHNLGEMPLDKTLSLDLETPSFKRAFDEITKQAGVTAVLRHWDDGPWQVVFGQADNGQNAQQSGQGLFVIQLENLGMALSKTVYLNDFKSPVRSGQSSLTVDLKLLTDPSLRVVGAPRARITRAEDEQGRSLVAVPNSNAPRLSPYSFYTSRNWERVLTQLRLRPPATDARQLAHLDGVMIYALITKTKKWEIPDLLAQKAWTREFKNDDQTFQVTVKPALQEGNKLIVNIEVASNQKTSYEQVSPPLLASEPIVDAIKIEDARNRALLTKGSSSNLDNGKLRLTETFYLSETQQNPNSQTKAPPLKFTFNAPVEVVQTEVPFSFDNVPLP